MYYTDYEIVREYNSAKYRNKKIGVLAQLNCVKRKDIIEVLERNGITVPQKYKDSKEEEYDYTIIARGEQENKAPKNKTKKAAKPDKQPKEKPIEKPQSAENRSEETEKPESITTDKASERHEEIQPVKEDPKDENLINEATYHLVQMGLARIDNRITKIERKQKKLKRLYKKLADLILG